MTDNEIIKAKADNRGEYVKRIVNSVNYKGYEDHEDVWSILWEYQKENLDTINRQKAEIEKLKEEVSKTRRKALLEASSKFAAHSDYHGDTILCKLICMAEGKEVKSARPLDKAKIKAEAIKEFAERLKSVVAIHNGDMWSKYEYIDNLVKEVVGDGNENV